MRFIRCYFRFCHCLFQHPYMDFLKSHQGLLLIVCRSLVKLIDKVFLELV